MTALSETFRALQWPTRNEVEDRILDRIAIAALRDAGILPARPTTCEATMKPLVCATVEDCANELRSLRALLDAALEHAARAAAFAPHEAAIDAIANVEQELHATQDLVRLALREIVEEP